jgi:ABC-type dipeptide/oligopeptide/nickel transport system permease subunit
MSTGKTDKKERISSNSGSEYRTPLEEILFKFKRDWFALIGVIGFLFILMFIILGPVFSPYDPLHSDYEAIRSGPSLAHPMGTDHIGRDIMTRVMVGGRYSLIVGFGAIFFATLVGATTGAIAGYVRNDLVDEGIMRSMDVLIAIPAIILGIAVLGMLGTEPIDLGIWAVGNVQKLIFVIGLVYIPRFARVMRGAVLKERNKDYVTLALLEGSSHSRLLLREILPNVTAPLLVLISYRIGSAMIVAAALGFLGIWIQAPAPSWGVMLAQGRAYLVVWDWWMIVFPGAMLSATIICVNIIGDGIRDAMDPEVSITD